MNKKWGLKTSKKSKKEQFHPKEKQYSYRDFI